MCLRYPTVDRRWDTSESQSSVFSVAPSWFIMLSNKKVHYRGAYNTERKENPSLRDGWRTDIIPQCVLVLISFLFSWRSHHNCRSTRTLPVELCDFIWSNSAMQQRFHVPPVELLDLLPFSVFAFLRLRHLVPDDSHSEKEWIIVSSGYQQTLICAFWNIFYIFRHLRKAANSLEINMRPSWQQWLAAELTFGLQRILEPGARTSILTSQHVV